MSEWEKAEAKQPMLGSKETKLTKKDTQASLFDSIEFSGPPRPLLTEALRKAGVYRSILDLVDLDELLTQAKKNGLIAIDFETDSLDAWNAHPIGLSLCIKIGEAAYVPLAPHASEDGPPSAFVEPEAVRERLSELVSNPDLTVVAHNAKYDYKVSRGWGLAPWKCRIWDSMVAAWIVDPERSSYSLDSLTASWLDLETIAYDSIVPKGKTFDIVPLELATRYASEDADIALRMKSLLEPCLIEAGGAGLFRDIEMPLLPILAEMEGAGIKIEGEVLRTYGSELAEELASIQREIFTLVGHEFNIASTKQLQEVLFVERKLKTGKKTKTGYSTDVGVLEELAREDPVPERILRFRTLAKLKSTYVDALAGMAGEDGRLRTHYAQNCGTATGAPFEAAIPASRHPYAGRRGTPNSSSLHGRRWHDACLSRLQPNRTSRSCPPFWGHRTMRSL
ncbi:hypothetical protein MASR2M78_11880 [Treponema sp.]